jgi:hypothetical protein
MKKMILLLLALLIGFGTSCYANPNYWKEKREKYEQAKKEAIQRGETFDPNEYERKEAQRIEENAMSPVTVILILVGIVVVIGFVVNVGSSIGSQIKNNTPEGKFWMVIIGIIGFILFVALMISLGGNKSSGSQYDSDEEYWENARMHTDGHGY